VIRAFPVQGTTNFADTFGAPREGGRTHQGVDIFAPEGSPVVAVDDGTVRFDENALGGHTAYVRANDGTVYYYAHLSGYEGVARSVKAGEVIGYVGHTGNAAHTPDHCHFEAHRGGVTENPYAELRDVLEPAGAARAATAPSRAAGFSGDGLGLLVLLYLLSRRR
jgi:murein DD-endopeptidase MepM/ murein hydrolase activator NlpD